jgi:hypothetical protein
MTQGVRNVGILISSDVAFDPEWTQQVRCNEVCSRLYAE